MCFTSKVSITMVYLYHVMGKTWGTCLLLLLLEVANIEFVDQA